MKIQIQSLARKYSEDAFCELFPSVMSSHAFGSAVTLTQTILDPTMGPPNEEEREPLLFTPPSSSTDSKSSGTARNILETSARLVHLILQADTMSCITKLISLGRTKF